MKVVSSAITDLLILEPTVFGDTRGFFFESYNQRTFEQIGLKYDFIQDNRSSSAYGTLRGLHFQKGEHAQTKLVSVFRGRILDVAVDLRPGSPTFKKHLAVELSEENKRQLLVPRGFAHGFVVLSETAEVFYKCDNFYSKESEGGIHFADPELKIDWIVPREKMILSEKDQKLPYLSQGV